MSAINHDTEVPTNSRKEVLMGYQYALHQHKKKLLVEKASLEKVRRAIAHQADHIGASTVRHRIPARPGPYYQRYICSMVYHSDHIFVPLYVTNHD
jgi:hypothetical protein